MKTTKSLVAVENGDISELIMSSNDLAIKLKMQHQHLLRKIDIIVASLPRSITQSPYGLSCSPSRRGDARYYEVTQEGILLLLAHLRDKRHREILLLILSRMIELTKKVFEENKKLKKQLLFANTESNEFGTAKKKFIVPKEKKTILQYNEEECKYIKVNASDLSAKELAHSMKSHRQAVKQGYLKMDEKVEKFVEAIDNYVRKGSKGKKPTPKDFGIHTEYQEFFED